MRTKSRAFTLVELLVVIGIVVVLIGILIPTLAAVKRSAMGANCASNLQQIGTACTAYQTRWSERLPNNSYTLADDPNTLNPPPPAGTTGAAFAQQTGYQSTSAREWFDAVAVTMGWAGKSTVAARYGANEQDSFRQHTQYLWCPQVEQSSYDPGVFATSYGICRDVSRGYNWQASKPIAPGTSLDFLCFNRVKHPSETVLIAESRLWNAQADAYDMTNDSLANVCKYNYAPTHAAIHHHGVNYLFFDGHVSCERHPPHPLGGEIGAFSTTDGDNYTMTLAADVAFRGQL